MLKTILIASLVSSMFLAAGRVHYSGLQLQTPMGSAYKMTPDPSNIWSFHVTYTITKTGKHSIPVLVDFDGNGKMDTEHKGARVLITDVSLSVDGTNNLVYRPALADDTGERWRITGAFATSTQADYFVDHFQSPLPLPVGSGLKVTFATSSASGSKVHIHLIGRLVTL